jgi:hypothetical protein
MRSLRATLFLLVGLTLAGPSTTRAQEPETRADALRAEREKKSTALSPPKTSRLERTLLDLESGRLFERILGPPEGLYPRIGNITAGSGISVGPGIRYPGLLGEHVDVQAFAAASFSRYWMVDARLLMPRLMQERLSLDLHGQRYSFPSQEFFGVGPDSNRDDLVTYGLQNTVVGASATLRPTSWLSIGGGVDRLAPTIEAGIEPGEILSLFDDVQAPGVLDQPDYLRYGASLDVNYRQPRGNPRRGGRYSISAQKFDDQDSSAFTFSRVDVNLEQYIPILRGRRVIALRALASLADAEPGASVPFYLKPTLGGPDDLRGFRRFRFRDDNALLLQAEYRWEIFSAMDGAIFYDAGKVASRSEDLDLRDLESDYGIGFRFGTVNGIFLRVEGAFGSRGGKHFILRFGNVF